MPPRINHQLALHESHSSAPVNPASHFIGWMVLLVKCSHRNTSGIGILSFELFEITSEIGILSPGFGEAQGRGGQTPPAIRRSPGRSLTGDRRRADHPALRVLRGRPLSPRGNNAPTPPGHRTRLPHVRRSRRVPQKTSNEAILRQYLCLVSVDRLSWLAVLLYGTLMKLSVHHQYKGSDRRF